jgi:hypothetical protein
MGARTHARTNQLAHIRAHIWNGGRAPTRNGGAAISRHTRIQLNSRTYVNATRAARSRKHSPRTHHALTTHTLRTHTHTYTPGSQAPQVPRGSIHGPGQAERIAPYGCRGGSPRRAAAPYHRPWRGKGAADIGGGRGGRGDGGAWDEQR